MKNIIVITEGETIKMRMPATEKADGTIWGKSGGKLIPITVTSHLPNAAELKAKYIEAFKRGDYNTVATEHFAKIGTIGPFVIQWSEDYDAKQKAKSAAAYAAISPAQKELMSIESAFYAANKRIDDTDDNNVMDHHNMLARAKSRMADWCAKYPADAAKREAAKLRDKADHKRSLAKGALTYDCDGWLSAADQNASHDEFMAEAAALEAQAAALENLAQ